MNTQTETLIGRAWALDKISAEKVAKAQQSGRIVKEYIQSAILKAIEHGLQAEAVHRPEPPARYIKMDEAVFYRMQSKSAKAGLTDSEFVRRAIRQHG